jgi:hypothetical protein
MSTLTNTKDGYLRIDSVMNREFKHFNSCFPEGKQGDPENSECTMIGGLMNKDTMGTGLLLFVSELNSSKIRRWFSP